MAGTPPEDGVSSRTQAAHPCKAAHTMAPIAAASRPHTSQAAPQVLLFPFSARSSGLKEQREAYAASVRQRALSPLRESTRVPDSPPRCSTASSRWGTTAPIHRTASRKLSIAAFAAFTPFTAFAPLTCSKQLLLRCCWTDWV